MLLELEIYAAKLANLRLQRLGLGNVAEAKILAEFRPTNFQILSLTIAKVAFSGNNQFFQGDIEIGLTTGKVLCRMHLLSRKEVSHAA